MGFYRLYRLTYTKEEAVDLEFKIAKDGLPNSLWDTYSSFANTDGGVIVLGVKEHKQQFIIEGLTKEQISQYKKTSGIRLITRSA